MNQTSLPFDEPLHVRLNRFITAVEREIAMREEVYPRRVARAAMGRKKAHYEIAVMRELRGYLFERLREDQAARAREDAVR